MKKIYIEDACCGIKIECPDEYSCMFINEYHDQESILRLTKPLAHNKAAIKKTINSIYGIPNGSSKCWGKLKTICALTDSEPISKKTSKEAYNKCIFSEIKDIIINDPATIILWKDGTKTIVKCQPVDTFDPGTGIAMAILKKLYGNSGFYKDIFEPAIEKYELKKSLEKSKKHVVTKKEKKSAIK